MKIAISTEDKNGLDSLVSHHFGRCPCYVFVEVEDQKVQICGSGGPESPDCRGC